MRRLLLAVCGAVVATVAIGPVPVAAAPLGALTLSQAEGTVDGTPAFAGAASTRPCPSGYGDNVLLRLGPPDGPYTNLARPGTSGGYDRAAVRLEPNRSFATALGGYPLDGQWWVVLECYGATLGRHPERFVTAITVTGRTWRVGSGPAIRALAAPTNGVDQRLTLTIPGSASPTPPPASPTPSPTGHAGGPLPRTGVNVWVIVLSGLALLGAGGWVLLVVRRRRMTGAGA